MNRTWVMVNSREKRPDQASNHLVKVRLLFIVSIELCKVSFSRSLNLKREMRNVYSHTPSETILKDTFPKMTVKTCKSSRNILETSNFGERSFIAKILADLIAKEDAFEF